MNIQNLYQITLWAIFIGILPLPYSYYGLLRLLVMCVCGYISYKLFKLNESKIGAIFFVIAILFNPISPFFFSKELWAIIDIAVGIYMFRKKDNILATLTNN